MPSPNPRLPPVTTTLRIVSGIVAHRFARWRKIDPRNKTDGCWYFVLRQVTAAGFEDRLLELELAFSRLIDLRSENHIGDDNGAGDRVLATAHNRYADLGMTVDDPLNL